MIKKIIFGVLAIALGVLGTLAVVYRGDVKDWFEKTFKQEEVQTAEDESEEQDEEDFIVTPNPAVIVTFGRE